ncbi:MAG: VCBS repeat-containing protein [Phycisphaerae bacterium]|nr:VCBS repeat-containing protein [Phycisphaerae bacterium]
MFHVKHPQLCVLALGICLSLATASRAQVVLRVDDGAPNGGNGQSWASAFNDLQAALAAAGPLAGAGSAVELWVAAGAYRPAGVGGPRSASFSMISNVALYGGFAGNELVREQRDPLAHLTVLSGDLNGNDGQGQFSDNVFHVVRAVGVSASARLDGFVIRGGRADGPGQDAAGGALLVAGAGGPVLAGSTVELNGGGSGGAAISVESGCVLGVSGTVLKSNLSAGDGGAIRVAAGARLDVDGCVFTLNSAAGRGGAVAVGGGAGTSFSVRRSTFLANSAQLSGGAVHVGAGGATVLVGSAAIGNLAASGGALASDAGAIVSALGSMFSGNAATTGEGGAVHHAGSDLTIVNCAFSRNAAAGVAGGVRATSGTVALANSLLWGNTGSGGTLEQRQVSSSGAALSVSWSSVQGWSQGGAGNNALDPQFEDPDGADNVAGTADDDLRLLGSSPAIDSGDKSLLPTDAFDLDGDGDIGELLPNDLSGDPRVVNDPAVDSGPGSSPHVDRGPYERNPNQTAWTSAAGGVWNAAANWQDGVVANAATRAVFDDRAAPPTALYTVRLPSNQSAFTMEVRSNWVTLDLNAGGGGGNLSLAATSAYPLPALSVGGAASSNARLTIVNTGATPRTVTAASAEVGAAGGAVARLGVNGVGSLLTLTDGLAAGVSGIGVVAVEGRGTLLTPSISLGAGSAGSGTLRVIGSGGLPSIVHYGRAGAGDAFVAASQGTASVEVSGGGVLRAVSAVDSVHLAEGGGSAASVVVSGAGSSWESTSGEFVIGSLGSASISLSSGGTLASATTTPVVLGQIFGASGSVLIGPGSSWNESVSNVVVSSGGVGRLEVQPGAVIQLAPGRAVQVNAQGTVLGGGTIGADVRNFGLMSPAGLSGPSSVGRLSISGAFDQRAAGTAPGGRLDLDLYSDDAEGFDSVAIMGAARLGGGLVVRGPFVPPDQWAGVDVLTCSPDPDIGVFDVALLPGLNDGRFFRVSYFPEDGRVHLDALALGENLGFGDSQDANVNKRLTAAAIGDVDGDGLPDLVVTTADGFVFLLINQGNDQNGWLGFSVGQQLPVGAEPMDVIVANLDTGNDSPNVRNEIAVANASSNSISVLSLNGQGQYVRVDYPTQSRPVALCGADFDGDGLVDLACANNASDTISVFLKQGGAGTTYASHGNFSTDSGPSDVDPFDPDGSKGDAGNSILVGNGGSSTAQLLNNDGNGNFTSGTSYDAGGSPSQVLARDVNNDGFVDAVTVNRSSNSVSILLNRGDQTFKPAVVLPIPGQDPGSAALDPSSAALADLDLDGDLDLVVVAFDSSPGVERRVLKPFRNDGSAGALALAPVADIAPPQQPSFVVHADVNGDGIDDLVAVSGEGAESLFNVSGIPSSPQRVCAADFNGDTASDDFDYFDFLNAFFANDATGDFNGDTAIDDFDYFDFLNAFFTGC